MALGESGHSATRKRSARSPASGRVSASNESLLSIIPERPARLGRVHGLLPGLELRLDPGESIGILRREILLLAQVLAEVEEPFPFLGIDPLVVADAGRAVAATLPEQGVAPRRCRSAEDLRHVEAVEDDVGRWCGTRG